VAKGILWTDAIVECWTGKGMDSEWRKGGKAVGGLLEGLDIPRGDSHSRLRFPSTSFGFLSMGKVREVSRYGRGEWIKGVHGFDKRLNGMLDI
jgi:hypothetical protein